MIVFGGRRVFGWRGGHENEALMMGLISLQKEMPASVLFISLSNL